MSENDTIPRVENLKNEMAGWLYFCPWYGWHLTGEQNNPVAWLAEMYKSEYCITLDELPDLKTYPISGFTSSPSTTKPMPTPTPSPITGYRVSGYVAPDFDSSSSLMEGFRVSVDGLIAETDENGYFFMNITPEGGKYKVRIMKQGYLTLDKDVLITGSKQISSSAEPLYLWAGDLGGDGAINMSDVVELATCFNSAKGDSRYVSGYDLNMDSSINMNDVMIIARHFNSSSANYPEIK
jgi:mannan endo-1,4-beta-mannosidase